MTAPRAGRGRGRLTVAAWGAVAVAAWTLAAAAAPAEEVVELPPFEVVAPGKPPPPWQYVALGNMEVLSRCSSSLTREFIEAHGRLTQLLQLLLPTNLQVKFSAPQIIILTDQSTTPTAAKEAIEGFAPSKKEPVEGRTRRGNNIRFIPNLRLNDTDAVAVYAILDDKTFRGDRIVLTPSHVRDVLERRSPPLPTWFIVGVIVLFQDMHFLSDAIEFEPLDWVSAMETERLRIDPDYPRTLLLVHDFFAGVKPRATPEAVELVPLWPRDRPDASDMAQIWKSQAALFVRWALDGDDPARRAGFWKFVTRTAAGPASEAVLQECLGLSYADLRDRLSDYLPGTLRNRLRVRAEKLVPVPPFTLQMASPSEIGRIKGDWERMEIGYVKARHPQFAEKYAIQAHRTLTEAYEKGERDPRLLGVIGLYECEVGNGIAARSYLEDAVRAKVVRPRVYLELARLRYAEAMAQLASGEQRLSAVVANRVLEPLAAAWKQAPPLAEAYLLAADVWVHTASTLEPPHFALLEEGRRLFPANAALTYYMALLKMVHGDTAGAESLIAQGLQTFSAATTQAKFEQLRGLLQRRTAAPDRP